MPPRWMVSDENAGKRVRCGICAFLVSPNVALGSDITAAKDVLTKSLKFSVWGVACTS